MCLPTLQLFLVGGLGATTGCGEGNPQVPVSRERLWPCCLRCRSCLCCRRSSAPSGLGPAADTLQFPFVCPTFRGWGSSVLQTHQELSVPPTQSTNGFFSPNQDNVWSLPQKFLQTLVMQTGSFPEPVLPEGHFVHLTLQEYCKIMVKACETLKLLYLSSPPCFFSQVLRCLVDFGAQ